MSLTPVKIIISARAGLGDNNAVCERLVPLFNDSHLCVDISIAHSGEELIELARDAARGPYKVIVAGGGDGTVNSVAAAVIEHDKILGVLPLGTLNHFARDLKIPSDLQAAAQTIIAGHTTEVDVGDVNNRIFLNNSSLGLYPTIVRERQKRERLGYRKWPAFVWATIQAFRRYPLLNVQLLVNYKLLNRRTPFVFVGNNEYAMDFFNVGMRERLDRGVLTIYLTHRTSRLKLLGLAFRMLFNRLRDEKDFLEVFSNQLKIQTRRKRLRVAFDGEVEVMQTPLQYRLRRRALRVIVPESAET